MTTTSTGPAAAAYAARVDAAVEQRTRLRGAEPPGDLFDGLPPDHPLLGAAPHEPLTPNVTVIAEYLGPDTVLVDVGGGAGRISLPLALRCARVINVEPSGAMGAAFERNAAAAVIDNAEVVQSSWESADPPPGTVALVNHVTYFTRAIVPFLEKLEAAGRERVIITVGSQPPPSRNRKLFELVHGEPERIVPAHAELVNVLWEMGRLPDVRMLPGQAAAPTTPAPTRAAAVNVAVTMLQGAQWAFWPMPAELEARARAVIESRFDELFKQTADGFVPSWLVAGREVLITWRPEIDRLEQ